MCFSFSPFLKETDLESGEVATELLEKNNKPTSDHKNGVSEMFEKKLKELEPDQKDELDGRDTKSSPKHENKTSSDVRNRNILVF